MYNLKVRPFFPYIVTTDKRRHDKTYGFSQMEKHKIPNCLICINVFVDFLWKSKYFFLFLSLKLLRSANMNRKTINRRVCVTEDSISYSKIPNQLFTTNFSQFKQRWWHSQNVGKMAWKFLTIIFTYSIILLLSHQKYISEHCKLRKLIIFLEDKKW